MKNRAIYLLLITFVAILACFNMPWTEFIGDDIHRILDKEKIFELGLGSVISELLPDRPTMMVTIWLNYVFGGMNAFGYKLVNILIHLLCGISVFFLLQEILRKRSDSGMLACAVACIFLAHPLNNQAVLSVIQRGTGMSTLFSLLSFLLLIYYITREVRLYYLLSLFCFLLAITSKPNTAILPVIFAVFLYFELRLDRKRLLQVIFPYLFVLVLPLLFYKVLQTNAQTGALSSFDYFLLQTRVVAFYFQKYFLPLDLHFFYSFNNDFKNTVDTYTPFFVAFHIVFLLSAAYWYVRYRSLWALGIVLGYLALMPESSFFPIYHTAFDHRNYFPIIFFALSFALLCAHVFKSKKYFTVVLAVIVLTLSLLNIGYTKKIDTYEKWALYNFEMNPTYKHHYIHTITLALRRSNFSLAFKLVAEAKKKNPNDTELDFLQAFENFRAASNSEKLKTIETTFEYACSKGLSLDVLYFYESLLNSYLPRLTDAKTFTYKLNRLYFTFQKMMMLEYSDPQLLANAESNFIRVLELNNRIDPDPNTFFENIDTLDALIALRNLIALKYYFGYQNIDVDKYESILRANYSDVKEAQTILAWLQTFRR